MLDVVGLETPEVGEGGRAVVEVVVGEVIHHVPHGGPSHQNLKEPRLSMNPLRQKSKWDSQSEAKKQHSDQM